MAERIQRKRTKGWRMPDNTVYVGRPTKWGNPYVVGKDGNRWAVLGKYTKLLYLAMSDLELERALRPLRGKNLACFCPLDQPCHADVLLRLANA